MSEPGLLVVDVAAADDATALAFQQLLADRWATATAEQTTRDAGQPGVRLRCYLDLRQQLTAAAVAGPTMEPTTARPWLMTGRPLRRTAAPPGRRRRRGCGAGGPGAATVRRCRGRRRRRLPSRHRAAPGRHRGCAAFPSLPRTSSPSTDARRAAGPAGRPQRGRRPRTGWCRGRRTAGGPPGRNGPAAACGARQATR
ncbi:DUF6207 family protein [Streptomyces sp. NPDC058676]|uniref:DUF6207 family protein n=1 Tax=unclassified Streptomyces TaxID=2593676 RepID=UPI003649C7A5